MPRARNEARAAAGPPLVSVVIPCYRQAELLPEAVASVALQTFQDWEIVVVDDGSPDDTSAVARNLARRLPGRRIRVQRQANRGLSGARNTGVRMARGRYVLPLDADDLLEPSFLERTVAALEASPAASIAFTDVQRFGAEEALWRMGPFTAEALARRNVACCTALYRREVWEAVGGYDETLRRGYEDWSFWISAVERGFGAVHVPEPLFLYRARPGSMIEATAEKAGLVTAEVVARHPGFFPAEAVGKARALLAQLGEVVPAATATPTPTPTATSTSTSTSTSTPTPTPTATHGPSDVATGAPAAPPAVSVVIPCCGQAHYLPEAVASVARQTFRDWEILVVDDGSPDDTAAVAARLAADLPGRLRVLRQENAGLATARNRGIAASRGRYVLPLDADDALLPTHLERTVAALEADPAAAIVTTPVRTFGRCEEVWPLVLPFELAVLREQNRQPYCSLFRRSAWERVGGYNPNLTHGYEDWDFWIGCAERGLRAIQLDEALFLYRVKEESMITTAQRHDRQLRARIALNHPAVYGEAERAEAARTLAAAPLAPPKPTAWAPAATEPAPAGPISPPAARPRAAGRRPPITLIFASYQHERWIGQAIASLAAQTQPFDRVLFFSDGSKDRTLELARAGLAGIPGVELLADLGENRGLTARLREAEARLGDGYVATLSGDDLLHPRACEHLRRQIAGEPAEWYVGGTVLVEEGLQPIKRVDPVAAMTAVPGLRLLDALLVQDPWLPANGWCYHVDLLRRVGGYDARFMIEDYVLATRFARATDPVLFPDVIGFWRKNEASMSHARAEQMHLDVASVATQFLPDAPRAAAAKVLRALAGAAAAAREAGGEARAARYEAAAAEFLEQAAATVGPTLRSA